MYWHSHPPLPYGSIVEAHGGILTGHWEFDLALLLTLLAVVAYSFLLPTDAPRGVGRLVIQSVSFLFFAGALILAVLGFRSL